MNEKIRESLSSIIDPYQKKDLVSLNMIKNIEIHQDTAIIDVSLPSAQESTKDQLKALIKATVIQHTDMTQCKVNMMIEPKSNGIGETNKDNLKNITHILAVSSCKGGVGKSTVAVNLAVSLQQKGAKVGLFDADIYGPSLPTMIKSETSIRMEGEDIIPSTYQGIKCMSFGYAFEQSEKEAAILRGPMVSQIVSQCLLQTKWEECDYLIIDLPPGTGDIQLTLCQLVSFSAAIIVTTPQYISFIDVVKGIEMFDTLKVPVIGAIENMSYLEKDGDYMYPFGKGALKKLKNEFGLKNSIALELDGKMSQCGDEGIPFMSQYARSNNGKKISQFTQQCITEINKIETGDIDIPDIGYEQEKGIIITFKKETSKIIHPKTLRLACKSALMIDEFTQELKINPNDIEETIYPLSMNPVGNYALGINWSDGHSSLYPYTQLYHMVS